MVTHREMRNNSGEILRAVAAGESVEVTNHGQVAAVISPPARQPIDDLVDRGLARPPRRSLSDLAALKRGSSELSSQELLRDVRRRE